MNRALEENRLLKSQLNLAKTAIDKKDSLVADAVNCTFVACPCTKNGERPNMNLLFKLRKKVMELRNLIVMQEVEITDLQSSTKFVKVRELMSEIESLRAIAEKNGDTSQNEIEELRK